MKYSEITKGMTREQKWAFDDARNRAAFYKDAARHARITKIAKEDPQRFDAMMNARAKHGFTVWQKSMLRGVQALSKALVKKSIGMGAMLTLGQQELITKTMSNPIMTIVAEAANAEREAIERAVPFEAYDPGPTPEPTWKIVGTEKFKGEPVTVMKHEGRPGQTLYVDREGEFVVVNRNGEVLESGTVDLETEEIEQ